VTAHLLIDQTPDVGLDESGEAVAACGLVGNLTGRYLPGPGVTCRKCARLEAEAELQRIDRERREAS